MFATYNARKADVLQREAELGRHEAERAETQAKKQVEISQLREKEAEQQRILAERYLHELRRIQSRKGQTSPPTEEGGTITSLTDQLAQSQQLANQYKGDADASKKDADNARQQTENYRAQAENARQGKDGFAFIQRPKCSGAACPRSSARLGVWASSVSSGCPACGQVDSMGAGSIESQFTQGNTAANEARSWQTMHI